MTPETDRKAVPSKQAPVVTESSDDDEAAAAGTVTGGKEDGPATGPSAAPHAAADSSDGGEQVSSDLDELAAKAAERDEYLALAQRTQADFENYRKRVARDATQAEVRGIVRLAKELLPGLDNLDRALAAQEAEIGRAHV